MLHAGLWHRDRECREYSHRAQFSLLITQTVVNWHGLKLNMIPTFVAVAQQRQVVLDEPSKAGGVGHW